MSKEPTNKPTPSVSHVNIRSNDSPHSQAHDVGSQIKLPKLVLKKFNGGITGLCSFWGSFEATIYT